MYIIIIINTFNSGSNFGQWRDIRGGECIQTTGVHLYSPVTSVQFVIEVHHYLEQCAKSTNTF